MSQDPVFILSAGWRSGSTLLQRMLTASGQILVWGEAGGAMTTAADMLERYRQMLGPGQQRFRHGFGGNGAAQWDAFRSDKKSAHEGWIASLNPPIDTVAEALRTALLKIYDTPAQEMGYRRWGIKEVQSGVQTAEFLRLLFPSAQFVLLVRNPLNTLRSIKQRNWIDQGGLKDPLGYFLEYWGRLATEFHAWDGGLQLRYEDLIERSSTIAELADYLNLDKTTIRSAIDVQADWPATHHEELTWRERRRAFSELREPMKAWGYV